jgi:outer membrane protein assembly factor BamB
MRLDTEKISFDKNPKELQFVVPDKIWYNDDHNAIWTNIITEDGKLYFLTSRKRFWEPGTVGYLVAITTEGKSLWKRGLGNVRGDRHTSLITDDNRIYVIDRIPSCYNKITGDVIYEKDADKLYEYTDAGAYLKGISFYNNKLYYATGMHSQTHLMDPTADPKRVKNIVCIDADTGSPVWGDLVPGGASISSFPLIHNGKAFIVTDLGLRVYEADTGKLIGVDKSVQSFGSNHDLMYNGLFIYPNRRGTSGAVLTAIRAD